MSYIYSIIDVAQHSLSAEKMKAQVASQNIANFNNPTYVAKSYKASGSQVFSDLISGEQFSLGEIVESPNKKISLDTEVVQATSAELRYEILSEIIRKKFGLLDTVIGGKK